MPAKAWAKIDAPYNGLLLYRATSEEENSAGGYLRFPDVQRGLHHSETNSLTKESAVRVARIPGPNLGRRAGFPDAWTIQR